jgi:hypothetical protein
MHREWRAWALDAAGNGRHRSIAGFAEQPDGVLAASQQSASWRRIFTVLCALCKAPAELVFGKGQLGDGVAGAGSKLRRLEPGQLYHASFWLLPTKRPLFEMMSNLEELSTLLVMYTLEKLIAAFAREGAGGRSCRSGRGLGSRAWCLFCSVSVLPYRTWTEFCEERSVSIAGVMTPALNFER